MVAAACGKVDHTPDADETARRFVTSMAAQAMVTAHPARIAALPDGTSP
jgi:hypothetical protein